MSKARKQALGAPPTDLQGIHRWLLKLQEVVETGLGYRGDGKAAFVEKQDLVSLGLAGWLKNSLVTSTPSVSNKLVKSGIMAGAVAGSGNAASQWVENVSPGPVTGLQAVGNAASSADVVLVWNPDGISFYDGVNVYRSSIDNIALAVKVGRVSSGQRMFVDRDVNSSQPVFYWVRSTSFTNTKDGPLNQTAGTPAVFDTAARTALLATVAMEDVRRVFGMAPADNRMDAQLLAALVSIGLGGSGGGVSDGNKGDVTVSGGGSSWQLNANSVGDAEVAGGISASKIAQDSSNRFVSDYEKAGWNSKQSALVSGSSIRTVRGQSLLGSGDVSAAIWTLAETAPVSPLAGDKWTQESTMIEYTWTGAEWVEL